MDSCPVILVNSQAISRNGFLNELTYRLVISLVTVIGSSRNSGKRSNPLSCFFRNYLESSPLKVNVGSDNLNSLRKTRGDKEIGEWSRSGIIIWPKIYLSAHQGTSSLQSKTSGTRPARAIP
jgi:hypothetical protein